VADNPYQQARYILSAGHPDQLPADNGREVAFAGRSNVGKSSVINTITGRKSLAKTSKTPGRTRQINFFSVTDNTRLVDLPGYGFARVGEKVRRQWSILMEGYFDHRASLAGLILIIDIRRKLTAEDRAMLSQAGELKVPVHVLINKADKLAFGARKQAFMHFRRELETAVQSVQLYSVAGGYGVQEARAVLDQWLFAKIS